MADRDTLSFVKASEHRPRACDECTHSATTAAHAAETGGVMIRTSTVHADDPLQLPETAYHHVTCLPLVTLHCATPTGSIERIEGYATLPDDVKRELHSELTPLLQRAVNVMRDVQSDEYNRKPTFYIHQQRIAQLQCNLCDRMLLDAVELPCCPAYPICSLCWQQVHLSSGVQVDVGGCDMCGKVSSLVTVVSCPSCRRSVEVAKVVEDSAMRARVGGKLVRCPNEKHGCEVVVMAKEARDHTAHCSFEAARRARADEGEADMDSDTEELKKGDEWEEVEAGSGCENDVDGVEDVTPTDEQEETGRTISFSTPLVTLTVAAPLEEKTTTEKANLEEKDSDVRMKQEKQERADNKHAEMDTLKPTTAMDAANDSTLTTSAVSCVTAQHKQTSEATVSVADDGVIPLVLTNPSGHTMSPILLSLRQRHSQSTDQSSAQLLVAEGAVTRPVKADEAAETQDRKRLKTEIVVD